MPRYSSSTQASSTNQTMMSVAVEQHNEQDDYIEGVGTADELMVDNDGAASSNW